MGRTFLNHLSVTSERLLATAFRLLKRVLLAVSAHKNIHYQVNVSRIRQRRTTSDASMVYDAQEKLFELNSYNNTVSLRVVGII